jgi:cysteine-rich repeat protein
MTEHKSRLAQFIVAAMVVACMTSSSLAAGNQPPAGQKCPAGSYVAGFDSETNIICTETCGNGVLNPGEVCDDGNLESGDSCSATCQSEEVNTTGRDEEIVAVPVPSAKADGEIAPQSVPADPVIVPSTPKLSISAVKPSKAVWGVREVTITVSGTGFLAGTVILIEGLTYSPSVNQAGTKLVATIATRNLGIGPYPVTVSNGPGTKAVLRKALEIY